MRGPLCSHIIDGLFEHRCCVYGDETGKDHTSEYRYELHLTWNPMERGILFVMLNPSTADEWQDDPTVRRCISFAKRSGFGSMSVVNLYALRATNPEELLAHRDPVGPRNDRSIRELASLADRTVVAWGAHKMAAARAAKVLPMLTEPMCFGWTADGFPKHPLYLHSTTITVPFAAR